MQKRFVIILNVKSKLTKGTIFNHLLAFRQWALFLL